MYPDFENWSMDEGRPLQPLSRTVVPTVSLYARKAYARRLRGCGWFHRENTPYDLIGVCM